MKRWFYIAPLIILAGFIQACGGSEQKKIDNPPEKVVKAFKKNRPEAKEAQWYKDGKNYEVRFKLGYKKFESSYNKDGALLTLEAPVEQLPQNVTKAFNNSKYKDLTIREKSRVKTQKHDELYKIQVNKDGKPLKLFYNKEGKLVRETTEE